jgi:hypothetical protein
VAAELRGQQPIGLVKNNEEGATPAKQSASGGRNAYNRLRSALDRCLGFKTRYLDRQECKKSF